MENPATWGELEKTISKLYAEIHDQEPSMQAAYIAFNLNVENLIIDYGSTAEQLVLQEIEKHNALPKDFCGLSLMSKVAQALRNNGLTL